MENDGQWEVLCSCCEKPFGDGPVAVAFINTESGQAYCAKCESCAFEDAKENVNENYIHYATTKK
jgi:hypothetical protein